MYPRSTAKTLATLGIISLTALGITACSSSNNNKDNLRLSIVTSTNVWGNIASEIAGNKAEITAIVDDPNADPHSFELSPAKAAQITDAQLVIYNGGGYDSFVEDVLKSTSSIATINAYNLLDTDSDLADNDTPPAEHDHTAHNEHLWYNLSTVDTVAHKIADELGSQDPANAEFYTANAEAFHEKLHSVTAIINKIAVDHPDTPIAQTEPIAHYLVQAADLSDQTPESFTEAVESGNDPSPSDLAATLDLLTQKKVKALIYNTQTANALTIKLREAAQRSNIPVVEVTETLPQGLDYISWQIQTAQSLAAALQSPQ
ncbi:MAG: metal ABC transporter solute-binding protein, Zn/Mn family [Mycobacteriaceae bacterium]